MLRSALWLGLIAPLLTGCAGFAVFIDDTHDPVLHPNRPIGNSETMRVIEGRPTTVPPLHTEAGNVWPGPIPKQPTLEDLAKQPMQPVPPLEPGTPTPSTANVPDLVMPSIPHHLQPRAAPGAGVLNGPLSPVAPSPDAGSGRPPPAATAPDKNLGITVPNGDGTSTVIAPDGSITTIPTPP